MFDQTILKESILESIRSLVDSNVIIGEAIVSGEITIIPVFKASIGIVSGSTPLGGGGGGVTVSPVTFIVIEKSGVKILSAGDTSTMERLVDAVPGLIDKIAGLLGSHKEEDSDGKDSGKGSE
ncbi:MAG: hypothetical protein LBQ61_00150 [Spirochaetales bacterium]|jgi:uncharacterized spore protein YtfJ|nr:hypothetical protein [Spirochaetales bacterium]